MIIVARRSTIHYYVNLLFVATRVHDEDDGFYSPLSFPSWSLKHHRGRNPPGAVEPIINKRGGSAWRFSTVKRSEAARSLENHKIDNDNRTHPRRFVFIQRSSKMATVVNDKCSPR